jgi:hypothetical protein
VPSRTEAPGCRDTAIALALLLGFAATFWVVGLAMIQNDACRELCHDAALTLVYAGGPFSALLGVLFGGLFVAWPLDATLWVVIAFVAARISSRRGSGVGGVSLVVVGTSLLYGLVLSLFAEIAV